MILDLRTGWELQSKTAFLAHPSEVVREDRHRRNKSLVNPNKIETLVALDQERYKPVIPFHGEGPVPPVLLNTYLQSSTAGTRTYAYNTQGERLPSSKNLNAIA